jgi:glucosylceramidase
VRAWITTADRTRLLAPGPAAAFGSGGATGLPTIAVDSSQRYQQIRGFGASLTDSSAWLIANKLNSSQRDVLMRNLFSADQGIGINVLRQPLGASDFSASGNYSFDDMSTGGSDPTLSHFSIAHDQLYVLPALHQAQAVNPSLTVIATSFSPPGWMKTSGSMIGGTLRPGEEKLFAAYLVKAVQAYQAAGVPIAALGIQNEPLAPPSAAPGMYASAHDEGLFIAGVLGPALAQAGVSTTVLGTEDNWADTDYAETLLAYAPAAPFVGGTAWHCYAGVPSAMSDVHTLFPTRENLVTECSGGTWVPAGNLLQSIVRDGIMAALRNWSSTVLLWNIALDDKGGPTNGGCLTCRGVVTINPDGQVSYNLDYYGLGQVSKFVMPGALRIGSTENASGFDSVAFLNPDGTTVLVVYNESAGARELSVRAGPGSFSYKMPGRSVATFTWRAA